MSRPSDKLEDLDRRIEAAREARKPPPRQREQKFAGAALAWRMMFELIAGAVIGLAMGWGLDTLFGTKPLFIIVMILLGVAAGVRMMIQTAHEAAKLSAGEPLNAPQAKDQTGDAPDRS